MSDKHPQFTLPVEYHTAIGVITINGALMDQLVDTAIWLVLKMPPDRGLTVTKLMVSTMRKTEFLRDLLLPMFKDKKVKKDFQNVYGKLRSSQKNRSKIVHAKWVFSPKDQKVHIEVPATDENRAVVEPMPLTKLQRYGTEIAQAHKALEEFFLRVEMSQDETGQHTWPPRYEGRQYQTKRG